MAAIDLINHVKRLACLFIPIAIACHSAIEQTPVSVRNDFTDVLPDTALMGQVHLNSRRSVKDFYNARSFSLFWSAGPRLRPAADSLTEIIANARDFGLNPDDYHFREIRECIADTLDRSQFSRLDVLLTDGFLTLHQHLRKGRLDPKTLQRRDLSLTTDTKAIDALQKIHEQSVGAELRSLEPTSKQYHLLKVMLSSFQLLAREDSLQRMRAETISLNLERWRWQKPWPDRYVFVNIPAFSLRVVESDSVWLKTPVIVGKRETPTPVLESVMRSFIIYPYWHVPHSISTKEILPSLKADASYLRRLNFDVLNGRGAVIDPDTIQWNLYGPGRFPFILRQREGSENSMGIIKFNFANNYNVYLHDTNSKRLYALDKRDLSHGCIRVKEAVALAHYLVREDDIYVSPDDLDQYLSLQQRLKIELRKPILLKLGYFTAEVENGATRFYDDIYKKDSIMMQALHGPVPSVIATAGAAAN